eukprot:jgi/Picre1/35130/NNA_002593.t1
MFAIPEVSKTVSEQPCRFAGLVFFGTITSLAAKIVYDLDGVGRSGEVKNFEKPWAMATVMFAGMSFCLPLAYYLEHKEKSSEKESSGAAAAGGKAWMLVIPTAFDLVATVLMNIGLLSVTASVYQMMRGAEMLFAALFAVVFLKRSLNNIITWASHAASSVLQWLVPLPSWLPSPEKL